MDANAAADRQRLLLKLADLVEGSADELAELESLDNGKLLRWAKGDIQAVVEFFRYMAGWATKITGRTLEVSAGAPGTEWQAFTLRQPVGVVGMIIPWNFPLALAASKLGPALATGCTCVLKPAEQTPLTALRLGDLIQDAGYPAGVVNIVTGYGPTAGGSLAAHPGVDKVSFTGSTTVGKSISRTAADTMKRVSLELGGKSPVIITADADLDQAISGAAMAIFFNQGQVCTAGSRLFVESPVFDKVVDGISGIAKSMRLGAGRDPRSEMGPLVSQVQLERVLEFIDKGRHEGGFVMTGGARHGDRGYFVEPTVFTKCDPDSTLVQEEIFGPVLVASPYKSVEDVAVAANNTRYGLAASIWSNNLSLVHKLAKCIKAGTVWVNCHNMMDANMPFGGFKQSGIGREMSQDVVEEFTECKSVLIKL
jgi:phenylacetaldehyde dehydrogenase